MEYNFTICDYLIKIFETVFNVNVTTTSTNNNLSSSNDSPNGKNYYVNLCYNIESNFIYFYWLFDLFKPLLTVILVLFLLPALIILFIYACSFFLFCKKHWNRLKVCNLFFKIFFFFIKIFHFDGFFVSLFPCYACDECCIACFLSSIAPLISISLVKPLFFQ